MTLTVTVRGVRAGGPGLVNNPVLLGYTPRGAAGTLAADERLDPLISLLEAELGPPNAPADEPWTDDHAPVEWVTDRMILAYAAEGGRLDEDELPTAP